MIRKILVAVILGLVVYIPGAYSENGLPAGNHAPGTTQVLAPNESAGPTPEITTKSSTLVPTPKAKATVQPLAKSNPAVPAPQASAPMAAPVSNPVTTATNNNGINATPAKVDPYRTFVTIQRYTMDNNGETSRPISNVRISVIFPNGNKILLPEGGQWWPIGNGQAQEINRTYEVPWAYIQADGFKFTVQMERKGSEMLPCQFDVVQLSQFNRAYTCHTDLTWQQNQNTPADQLDKEGIQVRVFTSKNSEPKDIPTNALALK